MTAHDLNEMIAATRGGSVTLWAYTVSLQELTLRVEFPGRRGNYHIVCNGTMRIRCATRWANADFVIVNDADSVELRDSTGETSIVTKLVRVLKDVEPVFAPT